jgi:error-prone DNA polymerase
MFVELHAQSAFTFLEGADQPEALVAEAAGRGMSALALVDRDGVYGAPRFHRAAVEAGIRPLVGSELTLAGGARLPVLVEDREGWQNLCRLITRAKLGAPKGKAAITLEGLEASATGLVCLTGGARGPLADAVRTGDRDGARRILDRLVHIFGRANVFVEIQRHFDRVQERDLERLVALARSARVPLLATNHPLYARPGGRALADVFTCIRDKTDLDRAGRRLLVNAERGLRDAATMAAAFRDVPDAVAASGELALRLGFTLKDLGYRFPDFPLPPGTSAHAHLRDLVARGVRDRYGASGPVAERARRQVAHELEIIGRLDLAGYFLIVWDIVEFCRGNDVLVQGRGSAANSAVCYALGITAVDPVKMDLLFERFLSESRGEWPDIDLDLPSGDRRERVIQYVYRRYGRLGAGMTANVITYRGRSAAREIGKALGLPADMQDRLARLVENWGYQDPQAVLTRHLAEAGCDTSHPRIRKFAALWTRVQDLPRHLGQHSGGMVIAAGRLDDVVPLEPATMPGRVVVQWDKDDCAGLGIVKVDLLGLRMMSVLQESIALVSETGGTVDLAHLPADDPTVYRMLQRADTIGVFQVESRAQMATLPRIHPERFYDLVVQIAIIRPGPIVGDMVHPYVRRRRGREPVSYAHPTLEPILARTLGVPLFQEQLLRMAMVAAGFTGSEAEELRRAFGFKRSERRMAEVEVKLREGMARRGITGEAADQIVHQVTSFALYGFPESHSSSFALLAYASAYLKAHHGPAFYTALLNNQPMGFYHSATVVNDARRRGVRVLPVDVMHSDWNCALERYHDVWAVRLGLRFVKGLRERAGHALVTARTARPFTSPDDLAARADLTREEMATLASIGALATLGGTRRANLWRVAVRDAGPLFAERDAQSDDKGRSASLPPSARPAAYAAYASGAPSVGASHLDPSRRSDESAQRATGSPLKEMTVLERLVADYAGTGVTVGPHPMALRRREMTARGVTRAIDLARGENETRVRVAGSVIVRQRPGTAKGFVFLSLEDETGIANVIVTPGLFARHRLALVSEPFLLVEGILQMQDGVVSVRAAHVEALPRLAHVVPSHDFG